MRASPPEPLIRPVVPPRDARRRSRRRERGRRSRVRGDAALAPRGARGRARVGRTDPGVAPRRSARVVGSGAPVARNGARVVRVGAGVRGGTGHKRGVVVANGRSPGAAAGAAAGRRPPAVLPRRRSSVVAPSARRHKDQGERAGHGGCVFPAHDHGSHMGHTSRLSLRTFLSRAGLPDDAPGASPPMAGSLR